MSTSAWLLTLADGVRVALGSHWMREVIGEHERDLYPVFSVPLMPDHCHQLMHWRNLLIPVLQLETLVGSTVPPLTPYHVVVAFSPSDSEEYLAYGVIRCCALPVQITVSDTLAVDYPHPSWVNYAASCFAYEGQAIPILDTAKVFDGAWNEDLFAN